MDECNSGFILCDISFNGELIADVKLPKACSIGNLAQGLWLDDNFRKSGLAYLKTKGEGDEKTEGEQGSQFRYSRGIDRSILRAYVSIRIMPAWKWLEFKDFIVDFENKKDCYTVGDVLGTLCTGFHKPILRIVPKTENEADDQEVKNIVQELLKTRSLATLTLAGCPLSTGMMSLIAQGKYTSKIGPDKCLSFIQWLRRQDLTRENLAKPEYEVETPKSKCLALPSSAMGTSNKVRITFMHQELDKMKEWFNENDRPNKVQMGRYAEVLNESRSESSHRLLSLENLSMWFKNKRSKKRKYDQELLEPWEKFENNTGSGNVQVNPAIGNTGDEMIESDEISVTKDSQENSKDLIFQHQNASMEYGLATMTTIRDGAAVTPRKIPRSRVTFDPNSELPYLNSWFQENERPNKEVIQEYTDFLNASRVSKKSNRLLSQYSIYMWFKNRRSKKRKGEKRDFESEVEDDFKTPETSGTEANEIITVRSMEALTGKVEDNCKESSEQVKKIAVEGHVSDDTENSIAQVNQQLVTCKSDTQEH